MNDLIMRNIFEERITRIGMKKVRKRIVFYERDQDLWSDIILDTLININI